MVRTSSVDTQDRRAFGVEVEYLLLDATTGSPVNVAAELIRAISGFEDQADHEYFACQLEVATSVCRHADDAEGTLVALRAKAARAAMEQGVILAGTGLPPVGGETAGTVTPKPRYLGIESQMRSVAAHQYGTGTHVHVEIPSRDAGIEVLARLARWSPVLLALTANSPLWCGKPTGFASWRYVMSQSWPVSGYPIGFKDANEYEVAVTQFINTGVVPDAGMLSWAARLSHRYPTVELRMADAQLAATDAVDFALLARALVDRAITDAEDGHPRPSFTPGLVNSANWIAARNGLGSDLIDPLVGETLPAFDLVERRMETIEQQLNRFGDYERAQGYLRRLQDHGDSASRQLTALKSGNMPGLLSLYEVETHRGTHRLPHANCHRCLPPVTGSIAPETNDASSEAR